MAPAVLAFTADAGAFAALGGQEGAKARRHVPDLLLGHGDGLVTVVDVKPARRLANPKVQAVFEWTEELVGLRGWAFEVWSDVDPVELANVRFLAGYQRPFTIDGDLIPAALGLVKLSQ